MENCEKCGHGWKRHNKKDARADRKNGCNYSEIVAFGERRICGCTQKPNSLPTINGRVSLGLI